MNDVPRWDLTALYASVEAQPLEEALRQSEEAFAALAAACAACESAQLPELLARFDRAALAFSQPQTYIILVAMTQPMTAALSRRQEQSARIKAVQDRVWNALLQKLQTAPDVQTLFDTHAQLAPYRYPVAEFRRLQPHRPAPDLAALIGDMRRNGGYGWMALRNQLDAAAAAPLHDGEASMPLPQLRGLAASADAQTRKDAYEAELRLYPRYETAMAACFSGIKGEALEELRYKRYDSVYDEMLDVNKLSARTLECMLSALEDTLGPLRRYLRRKARLLGHPDGMPWYDMLAPAGGLPTSFTFEQAGGMLCDALGIFSGEIGALARRALENGWIDALPAAGKQSGAISIDLPATRENRILLSYTGSFRCVRTMAHELGHAYHARCLDGIPLLLRDAPTPICETASLMNETIFLQKSLEQMKPAQRFALLESDLQESTQTLLDIYSRFLFEKEAFAARRDHALLADELCAMMTSAQRRVYADALDPARMHPYMWMCKVHYYIPEFHYYNYPYIFGLLFSKGLYARYLDAPRGFDARYRALLAGTCSGSLEQIAAEAGIEIGTRQFWDDALRMVVRDVDEWLRLAENQTAWQ